MRKLILSIFEAKKHEEEHKASIYAKITIPFFIDGEGGKTQHNPCAVSELCDTIILDIVSILRITSFEISILFFLSHMSLYSQKGLYLLGKIKTFPTQYDTKFDQIKQDFHKKCTDVFEKHGHIVDKALLLIISQAWEKGEIVNFMGNQVLNMSDGLMRQELKEIMDEMKQKIDTVDQLLHKKLRITNSILQLLEENSQKYHDTNR